jgi:hypothetical protein
MYQERHFFRSYRILIFIPEMFFAHANVNVCVLSEFRGVGTISWRKVFFKKSDSASTVDREL